MGEQLTAVQEGNSDLRRMPRIEPRVYEEVDETIRKTWDEMRPLFRGWCYGPQLA